MPDPQLPNPAPGRLPRYQEDSALRIPRLREQEGCRAARSAVQGGGPGTIMNQGPIADPEYLANSFWVPGRADLFGIRHITPGSEGDWGNSLRSFEANVGVMSLRRAQGCIKSNTVKLVVE